MTGCLPLRYDRRPSRSPSPRRVGPLAAPLVDAGLAALECSAVTTCPLGSSASPEEAHMPEFDTSVPHIARVYDYWLGGKDNISQVVPASPYSGPTVNVQKRHTNFRKSNPSLCGTC